MVVYLGYFFTLLPLVLIGILFSIFWIMMLVDSATRKFKNSNDKIVWVLVIILTGIIGSLIYYFVVYNKDKTKSIHWFWGLLLFLILLMGIFAFLAFFINFSIG